jgi:NADH-quinone oxidoreductase subunit L
MTEITAWSIFLLPLTAFLVISLIIRPFFNRYDRISGYIAIFAVATGFLLSIQCVLKVWANQGKIVWPSHSWITVESLEISVGILMDPLTAIMLVVVSGVSLMVQVYSQGYMHGDTGYSRYFAYISLFTASMIGLVLAGNIIQIYFFWELVGVCSYLLIGFWFHKPSAIAAAKKAFLVTRLGDFGFLLAILYLFVNSGEVFEVNALEFTKEGLTGSAFDVSSVNFAAKSGFFAGNVATLIALGIFAGAVGKSAQFPLHVWLPDAMEGPTPVSALIHAATMVVAGIFLVARFLPLFEVSSTAMNVVALTGGITALFAATMGLVMYDIKRVLAYSTVSQLGFMMLALGIGAYGPAIFHLFTHAFFKALLFLGSGSVNHATGTFDMRYMGGLRKYMPWTYYTFLIGSLSISGIFPLAGFWSKDEIIAASLRQPDTIQALVAAMALVAAFMTAFYMFRALFMTFHGEFKGGISAEPDSGADAHSVHLVESPMVMVFPMIVLAVPAVVAGFVFNPIGDVWGLGVMPNHWFSHMLDYVEYIHVEIHSVDLMAASISTLLALSGIGLAYLMYIKQSLKPSMIIDGEFSYIFKPIYKLIVRKYFFDELYEKKITISLFYNSVSRLTDWFDKNIVDRIGNIIGFLGRNSGKIVTIFESGQTQVYGGFMTLGIIGILLGFFLWG